MSQTAAHHIYPCGDHAVTIELGKTVDTATNQRVLSLFQHLRSNAINGIRDVIPAYHTVTVVYDIVTISKQARSQTVYDFVCDWIGRSFDLLSFDTSFPARNIRIPVCYDPAIAPDIVSLASGHGISAEEVVSLHSGMLYRVYMLGFLPGFAYMGSVDKKIATPRKQQPRTHVPKGSVGIAGEQTGIYPFDSPGGWQLIGQTPVQLFDKNKPDNCYLQPGDEVSFYPISFDAFSKWSDQ